MDHLRLVASNGVAVDGYEYKDNQFVVDPLDISGFYFADYIGSLTDDNLIGTAFKYVDKTILPYYLGQFPEPFDSFG